MENCSICLESLSVTELKELCCGHTFHQLCIEGWTVNHGTCPICREWIDNPLEEFKPYIKACANLMEFYFPDYMEGLSETTDRFVESRNFARLGNALLKN